MRKGCGHCCKTNVDVTDDEVNLLLEHIEEEKIELDWEKIKRQSNHDLSNWKDQAVPDRSCVFLNENNECKVYNYRPMNCRKLLVITDPKHCDIISYPKHQVGRINSIQAEILATAVGTATEFGPMAKMILKANKNG